MPEQFVCAVDQMNLQRRLQHHCIELLPTAWLAGRGYRQWIVNQEAQSMFIRWLGRDVGKVRRSDLLSRYDKAEASAIEAQLVAAAEIN